VAISKTILLIEDEEPLIEVLSEVIEKLGYLVMEARTGMEAIAVARLLGQNIDCALLDIVLPDMAAIDVYRGLMEAHPGLTVLVSTGSDLEGPVQDILAAGAQGFIQKPYTLEALSEKLKELGV
jgi:two-component system cell cycle sensor histidine kinase/response regulator CckA